MEDYLAFYPEMQQAGGLPGALDAEFVRAGSAMRALQFDYKEGVIVTSAEVRQGNTFVNVNIAAQFKLYMASFWRNGVCLAHSGTPHLALIAAAAEYWLTQNSTTRQLAEKYPFI